MCVMCVFSPQYMSKVEPWCKACGEGELPSELQDLEDTIHHHQGLYEHITTAYSEVSTHILTHTHTQVNVQNTNINANINANSVQHKIDLIIIQIMYSKYTHMPSIQYNTIETLQYKHSP